MWRSGARRRPGATGRADHRRARSPGPARAGLFPPGRPLRLRDAVLHHRPAAAGAAACRPHPAVERLPRAPAGPEKWVVSIGEIARRDGVVR